MNEELKICEHCNHRLVWHEGSYSGWVHSNNFRENLRLYTMCQERRQAKRKATILDANVRDTLRGENAS